jgi:hypothetical protein
VNPIFIIEDEEDESSGEQPKGTRRHKSRYVVEDDSI